MQQLRQTCMQQILVIWIIFNYALASTNNNKQNNFSIPIFFSDSLIEKKSTHSQIKYFNQNWKSKHTQKSLKFENIKKNNKKINT